MNLVEPVAKPDFLLFFIYYLFIIDYIYFIIYYLCGRVHCTPPRFLM